jgi:hypothetical protein
MSSTAEDDSEIVSSRGQLLYALECSERSNHKAAILSLQGVLDRDPLNIEALSLRGQILKALGIFDLAAKDMQTIREIRETSSFAEYCDDKGAP